MSGKCGDPIYHLIHLLTPRYHAAHAWQMISKPREPPGPTEEDFEHAKAAQIVIGEILEAYATLKRHRIQVRTDPLIRERRSANYPKVQEDKLNAFNKTVGRIREWWNVLRHENNQLYKLCVFISTINEELPKYSDDEYKAYPPHSAARRMYVLSHTIGGNVTFPSHLKRVQEMLIYWVTKFGDTNEDLLSAINSLSWNKNHNGINGYQLCRLVYYCIGCMD